MGIAQSPTCVGFWHQLYKVGRVFLMVFVPMLPHAEFGRNDHREYALHFTYSIENVSFGGLFFQDQISFSFRLTITSFLKEFSAMKHLNSGGFSTFFAKITDFVKMISEKWRINFFLNIWIGQSESLFRMTQSTSNAPIADVTALKLNSVLHNIGGRP